jgi:thiol-disulfide isomerase/thioredoxin
MKQKLVLLTMFSFLFTGLVAQEKAYEITVKMPVDATQGKINLAHYFGNNQYIKVDSAVAQNGIIIFSGEEPLKGGLYLIVYSPGKFYDFVVTGKPAEQFMTIEADTADYVSSVKFTNSPDNDILFNYRRFLKSKSEEARIIQTEAGIKNDGVSKQLMQQKMQTLQKEVSVFMAKTVADNEDTFAAKVINANIDPELPIETEIPMLPSGKKDSTYLFKHYKAHFFDNLDFSDDRLLRTPFIQTRLDKYFKDLVYQVADSVIIDCDLVLKLSKENNEVYRYVLWWTTNRYETTEIVGLDAVFIHLAENYYLKDADWLDSTQRVKFQERVNILKPLQTGKVFPELTVYDLIGKEQKVANGNGEYTVVVFYSPDCGHCKDSAPELVKFYNEYKDQGIEVFNISTDYEPEKMKKFIVEYKTEDLINVWDAKGNYYFRNAFDVYSTPTTYVLDSQKRIIGKRIPIEELGRFLEFQKRKTGQANLNKGK